ncbi:hypothetical protein WG66_009687, partial [Moniliophthora roreri]
GRAFHRLFRRFDYRVGRYYRGKAGIDHSTIFIQRGNHCQWALVFRNSVDANTTTDRAANARITLTSLSVILCA